MQKNTERNTLHSVGGDAAQGSGLLPQATLDRFSLVERAGITESRDPVWCETWKTWCSRTVEQEDRSMEAFTVFLRWYVKINVLHGARCAI